MLSSQMSRNDIASKGDVPSLQYLENVKISSSKRLAMTGNYDVIQSSLSTDDDTTTCSSNLASCQRCE